MSDNSGKAWKPAERRFFIGGSDARIVMGSDEAALVRLWREKRGEAEPEDLSGNLIVQLGRATEDLNRSWYERNTGRQVRDVQRQVRHSAIPWMAATLDGIVEGNSKPNSCCPGHSPKRQRRSRANFCSHAGRIYPAGAVQQACNQSPLRSMAMTKAPARTVDTICKAATKSRCQSPCVRRSNGA